jgi:hypothetical protein
MEMWEGSKRKQQGYIRAVRGACGAAHCHPGLAGPSVIIDTRLPEMFLGWSGGHERPHMGCPSPRHSNVTWPEFNPPARRSQAAACRNGRRRRLSGDHPSDALPPAESMAANDPIYIMQLSLMSEE